MDQNADFYNGRTESTGIRNFNKKKWREQKYSKHQKIEQWQERRKKAALHKYRKMLRKENMDAHSSLINQPKIEEKYVRKSRYQKALEEYERKCQEKEEQRQEAVRVKAEKEEARKRSQAIRAQRQQKLAKKTRKGQPVMKERLEMMLEKIQQMQ